ncbi:acyl-CoA thioesterase [Pseudoprimorskyibacter insulae]|uniref:4-hydroxybenzoyl-CoA thioesterase n=1 Tax=Pseudoprimorskyibacter insulae TaxID=1695997 RepID=A0A2R8ATI4_9RHOB|nr:acyl-CoA thioesterase [Pseudoprimorskyibacter insulae]SPF79338.1 4-hydroxybenzoyl-CoA thioesterase [Pseudoprimorskyibacter insulae]
MSQAPLFHIDVQISFGHCDAAGIVFYPNYFRWFDRCFHTFLLHRHGGHAAVCKQTGSRGIGLMSADAKFRSPGLDGDLLTVEMGQPVWGKRSLTLPYRGLVGERILIEGEETRGIFAEVDGRLTAAPTDTLRQIIEG